MDVAVTLLKLGAHRRASLAAYLRRRRHARVSGSVFPAVLCAVALASCAVALASCAADHTERGSSRPGTAHTRIATAPVSTIPISLQGSALLEPQPKPDCEFKTAGAGTDERMKLDYERQCYRHSEIIARDRLQQLQAAVGEAVNSVKRRKRGGS